MVSKTSVLKMARAKAFYLKEPFSLLFGERAGA